jgi:flavin reductase (DIM6/NTAB) family NADH-FMN oxidoreductase RutF
MAANLDPGPLPPPRHGGLPRDPATPGRALRDALGCFPTGVAVVTGLAADGRPFGLTINSFTSLSLEPPLILWSLRSESPLRRCFHGDARFAVNVLGSAQEPIARQFASPRPDRFAGIRWRPGPGGPRHLAGAPLLAGLPHLEGAVAWFDCRLRDTHDAGDHRILIGGVERFATAGGEPLLFVQGGFRPL